MHSLTSFNDRRKNKPSNPGIVSENHGISLVDRVAAKTPFGNAAERVDRARAQNRDKNNSIIAEDKAAAKNPRPGKPARI